MLLSRTLPLLFFSLCSFEVEARPQRRSIRTLIVGSGSRSPNGAVRVLQFDGSSLTEVSNWSNGLTTFGPSWLQLNGDVLYSSSDSSPELYALKVASDKSLTSIGNYSSLPSINFEMSPDKGYLLSTSYVGAGYNLYSVDKTTGSLKEIQSETYTGPVGPATARQNTPHLHQARYDPSGKFVVVPDLGSDYLRIYSVDPSKGLITSISNITITPAGTGPRHGVFYPIGSKTPKFYFLVTEIGNHLQAFSVTYSGASMSLTHLQTISTYGPSRVPDYSSASTPIASTIQISHDNQFLYVVNRGDTAYEALTGFDSVSQFRIDAKSGLVTYVGNSPTGGTYTRAMWLDRLVDGYVVMANLVGANSVAIYQRNLTTGVIGSKVLASLEVPGGAYFAGFADELSGTSACCASY